MKNGYLHKMEMEFDIIFRKSFISIKKYWLGIFFITFITEGLVSFLDKLWKAYLSGLNLSFLGGFQVYVTGLLGFLIISVLTPVGKSCMAYYIYKKEQNEEISGVTAYIQALRLLPSILVASILWYFGTIFGLIFLIFPGLWFFFSGQFVAQSILVERISIRESFRKSRELVGKNFGMMVIIFITLELVQGIIGGIFTSLILATIPFLNNYIYFVDWFVAIFTGAFVYVPLAVMYLERRKS